MKKLVSAFLVLSLLATGTAALAEQRVGDSMYVANCKESITLREEPSKSADEITQLPLGTDVVYLQDAGHGFAYVGTEYGTGYVLTSYIEETDEYDEDGTDITGWITESQRYDINLFMSNFTEADLGYGKGYFDTADDAAMVDFAIDHIWYNQNDKVKWIGDNTVQLKASEILAVTKKYFDTTPSDMTPKYADYDGTYYTWEETGGHVPAGFACVTSVEDYGGNCYRVFFDTYGTADGWENTACGYTIAEAKAEYGERDGFGSAVFTCDDLNDRSSFRLLQYAWAREY